MPTVDVVDLENKKVGTLELPSQVFGCEPRAELVHEAVVMQRACERQGTASTRRRGEVSGSGKKPWKQKHTGRARAGSLRSPVWRHGGTVFGPKPRSYAYSMPKKKYRAALQGALSAKVSQGRLIVLSDLTQEAPKTKWLARSLDRLRNGEHALVVVGSGESGIPLAARNLPDVTVLSPDRLNVYDVVRAGVVVLLQGEVGRIQEVWS
ncbi:50S ribosomal protein L4 [Candidatus Nitrospira inopinata]|jgi:large subunit ribosomal protein L4|uniref:Large ribosomal subunit protein uL4 n=1 Tax=Candidatus Nitrospira inopinata TaxID=1715989 RepID=A0A0S4KQI6_9BACT|nr:50S ribosomal protein L4 [Candidatus Nitrospira inopinata]CUQ66705.1 50S ribosomal subunit protein L4 [Candidatus Nitrospira inopinata]